MPQKQAVVVITQRFIDEATLTYLADNNCEVRIADLPPGQADGGFSESQLINLLAEADGWIVGHAKVTTGLLKALPRLQIIARRGVGYDRVDTEAVKASGKVATIAVDCNDSCVADHTIGMMLSLGHKLRASQQQMLAGDWSIQLGTDLYLKTVGIVGLGRIARALIQRLIGFEVKILVSTPHPDIKYGQEKGLQYTDLDTLLRQSDYVSLHAPLTPQTRSMINAAALSKMKNTAFLINTARGGLVDDAELLLALNNNAIAGAGLDVYQSESDSAFQETTETLIALPNVIAAPHSGASTREGLNRTNMAAAHCVVAILKGESPPSKYIIADGRVTSPHKTLYDKLIDSHTVRELDDQGHVLLYIDRQVANEYTSPQAFSGLRDAGRSVWQPKATLGVVDHVNPTTPNRTNIISDTSAMRQVTYFEENCKKFGIELIDILDERQGIEHVVAPEQGYILPGMVVAAGDSHTTTYGALGAFGFGIGTSEIEHLLATQTLVYKRLKTMRVNFTGSLAKGLTSKDMIMALIGKIGAAGANDYAIEFSGSAITALSVEARMTICNMAVEAGARGAFMAPDEKVFAYLKQKPRAPKGDLWRQAVKQWRELFSDTNAIFDRDINLDISQLAPQVTWGTSPDQVTAIGGHTPEPCQNDESRPDPERAKSINRALTYMGLERGMKLEGLAISHAFIGSCTNARIEDLRGAASIVQNNRVAKNVRAIIVPGSTPVRKQAEAEGLAQIFIDAGFEWRQSGCSMCLAMNDDVLKPGDRCASSTNRNFEGRQGAGARTHLMSPEMVAAAAIRGHLTDLRHFLED